ncbi:MAG: PQQ-binding-like beta-propeller repeat protein [Thermomicrobiales bacterium]|nr:PQQ-binding-like beta-propeller repeat protein [Thermomicrobiales bacterium]
MRSHARYIVSLLVILSLFAGIAVLPVSAQDGTPEASPAAVDPALVAGFATAQGNFARTGEVDVAGPVGNPVLRWQITLPAGAPSEPVSSAGLTFIPTEGPLVAIDLATGDVAWTADQQEGTASAPTLVDGVLYQGTWGAGLRAIDAASGAILWTYLWENENRAADPPRNSSDGTPVVVDGVVYMHGQLYGRVFAVDAATGTEIWNVDTEGGIPGNLVYVDGKLIYAEDAMFDMRHQGFNPGPSGLRALDAATGETLWKFDFPEGTTTFTSPAALDGVVVGGASNPNAQTGAWFGVDVATGEEVWSQDAPTMWNQFISGSAGTAITTGGEAGLLGRDIQTGEIRWEVETVRWAGAGTATADGISFVHDNEGVVVAFDAATGYPVWTFETVSTQYLPFPSQVGVATGLVLAIAGDQLFAIEGDGQQVVPPAAMDTYPPAAQVADDFDSYATLTDVLTDDVPELVQGIALGPDGTLYAVDPFGNRIVQFGPDGNFLSAFGESGSGEGQFQFDMDGWTVGDIFVAPDGTIYVADAHNGRVQVFDKDWNFIRAFGDFTVASGVGVDLNTGVVYVGDQEEGVVHVFDAEGNSLGDWGRQGADWTDKLALPTDVVVGADGRVYVSEFKLGKVRVYSADGDAVGVIGGWGSDPGRLARNWGISFDADGNLIVSNYGSGTVVSIPATGR